MIVGVMTLSKVPQKTSIRAMRESCSFVLAGNHASLIVSAALATLALSSLPVGTQTEGRHPPIAVVGQDGNPYTAVHYLVRLNAQATKLEAVRLGQVWSGKGSQPVILGGD